MNEQKEFDYRTPYGETERVQLCVHTYERDWNLYVGMDCRDPDSREMAPFTDVTVNITGLPYLFAAVDTNNNGFEIMDFLVENKLARPIGQTLRSGYCEYPVVVFDEKSLERLDPAGLKEYRELRGMEPPESLKEQAKDRTSEKMHEETEKERKAVKVPER